MIGRFFALEMGCPDGEPSPDGKIQTVAFLNDDGSVTPAPAAKAAPAPDSSIDTSSADSGSEDDTQEVVCECRGLGCDKCKKKKKPVKIFTISGPGTVPVMNLAAPFQPSMIMLARRNLF